MVEAASVGGTSGPSRGRKTAWLAWMTGLAVASAVVIMSLHASEGRQAFTLIRHVRWSGLGIAVMCQLATYAAQAEVWRMVGRAAGRRVRLGLAWRASLAKLFIDQTLPSAGIASSVMTADALGQSGVDRPKALAAVSLNLVSYNAAYVVALTAALGLAAAHRRPNLYILGLATLFILFCTGMSIGVLTVAGRGRLAQSRLARWPFIRQAVEFVADAEPGLVRRPALLVGTTVLQLAIIAADLATILALIASLGQTAAFRGVFISFMVSSLIRTMGFVPGGLGTFEAASVLTLKAAGLPVSAALSTTILFRALSFWLPILPGFVAARRLSKMGDSGRPAAQTT
jgi:uncharacterized protein (TIRG00374 family)